MLISSRLFKSRRHLDSQGYGTVTVHSHVCVMLAILSPTVHLPWLINERYPSVHVTFCGRVLRTSLIIQSERCRHFKLCPASRRSSESIARMSGALNMKLTIAKELHIASASTAAECLGRRYLVLQALSSVSKCQGAPESGQKSRITSHIRSFTIS